MILRDHLSCFIDCHYVVIQLLVMMTGGCLEYAGMHSIRLGAVLSAPGVGATQTINNSLQQIRDLNNGFNFSTP